MDYNVLFSFLKGNSKKYDLDNLATIKNSLLEKKIGLFLGSSVTLGYGALGISFADYIAKKNNCVCYKEVKNGTTLVDDNAGSYYQRLKNIDPNRHFDYALVQLSTNDASQNKTLGNIKDETPQTICGAINAIITYIQNTFHCPVLFYTNPYYKNDNYQEMVDSMKEIARKRNIKLINLYEDKEFNNISKETRKLYMADDIHPTKAGYLEWLLPRIESEIEILFKKR